MNPLIREASSQVGLGWLMAIMTVVFIAVFVMWCFWIYAPQRKAHMESFGRLPLDDGDEG